MDKWQRKVSQEQTHAYRNYTHKVVQQMTGEQRVWSFSRYEDNCSLVGGGGSECASLPHAIHKIQYQTDYELKSERHFKT